MLIFLIFHFLKFCAHLSFNTAEGAQPKVKMLFSGFHVCLSSAIAKLNKETSNLEIVSTHLILISNVFEDEIAEGKVGCIAVL